MVIEMKRFTHVLIFITAILLLVTVAFSQTEGPEKFLRNVQLRIRCDPGYDLGAKFFESETNQVTVEEASMKCKLEPDNPHWQFQLAEAMSDKKQSQAKDNYQLADSLFEKRDKQGKLQEVDYVEWAKAHKRVSTVKEAIVITERGYNELHSEAKQEILRTLVNQYLELAFMGMLGVENSTASDFTNGRVSQPTSSTMKDKRGFVEDCIKKSILYADEAISSKQVEAIDYFNRQSCVQLSLIVRKGYESIETELNSDFSPSDIASFTKSFYLDKALSLSKNPAAPFVKMELVVFDALSSKNAEPPTLTTSQKNAVLEIKKSLDEAAEKPNPPAMVYDALVLVGYFNDKPPEKLQSFCLNALEKDPALQNAFAGRISYLIGQSNWKEAVKCCQKKYLIDNKEETYAMAASFAVIDGELAVANQIVEEGQKNADGNTDVNLALVSGVILLHENKYYSAVNMLEIAQKANQSDFVVGYDLAIAYYITSEHDKALSCLGSIKTDRPTDIRMINELRSNIMDHKGSKASKSYIPYPSLDKKYDYQKLPDYLRTIPSITLPRSDDYFIPYPGIYFDLF